MRSAWLLTLLIFLPTVPWAGEGANPPLLPAPKPAAEEAEEKDAKEAKDSKDPKETVPASAAELNQTILALKEALRAKTEPAAKPPEHKPARVVFTNGQEWAKTWVDERANGSWIVYQGSSYWFLKKDIAKIEWLTGEPDEELKRSLAEALEKRRKEEEAQKRADEERARKDAEAVQAAANAAAPAGGDGGTVAAGPSAPAKGPDKPKGGQTGNSTTGGGGDGRRDDPKGIGHSKVYGGAGGNVTPEQMEAFAQAQQQMGAGDGTAGGVDAPHVSAAFQWLVRWVDRKHGLIRIRNLFINQGITLHVQDPGDLSHVHKGDILVGVLSAGNAALAAPDGTSIEFGVGGP